MNNILVVIGFEVKRNIRKKSFWFSALALPLIIIVVYTVSFISSNDAANKSQQQSQTIAKTSKVAVLDDTSLINTKALTKQHITIEPNVQSGIAAVKADKVDAFIYYPKNVSKTGIKIYSQDSGISFSTPYTDEATAILKLNVISKVSAATRSTQIAQLLEQDPNVSNTTYKSGKQTNSLASLIVPGLFMLLFLVLMVLMSYLMVTSTTEEKENRVAEILLTSVKARSVIVGKILSILVLGVVQIASILVPLLVGYVIFRKHISLPDGLTFSQIPINGEAITFGALFLVGGLVLFTGMLVGLSAMFPSAQEAGRYLGVSLIWAFIPMYTIAYIISSPHALIVSIFTYFPLTAPTTSLLRNAVGTLSTRQALVALLEIYACATLAVLFAIRAFRYGAMEYGRRIGIKELFR